MSQTRKERLFSFLRGRGISTEGPAGRAIAAAIEQKNWGAVPPPLLGQAKELAQQLASEEQAPADMSTTIADETSTLHLHTDNEIDSSGADGAVHVTAHEMDATDAIEDAEFASLTSPAGEVSQANPLDTPAFRMAQAPSYDAPPSIQPERPSNAQPTSDAVNSYFAGLDPDAGKVPEEASEPQNSPDTASLEASSLAVQAETPHASATNGFDPQAVANTIAAALEAFQSPGNHLYPLADSPGAAAVSRAIETLRPFVPDNHPVVQQAQALTVIGALFDAVQITVHRELRDVRARAISALDQFESGVSPHLVPAIKRDVENQRRLVIEAA